MSSQQGAISIEEDKVGSDGDAITGDEWFAIGDLEHLSFWFGDAGQGLECIGGREEQAANGIVREPLLPEREFKAEGFGEIRAGLEKNEQAGFATALLGCNGLAAGSEQGEVGGELTNGDAGGVAFKLGLLNAQAIIHSSLHGGEECGDGFAIGRLAWCILVAFQSGSEALPGEAGGCIVRSAGQGTDFLLKEFDLLDIANTFLKERSSEVLLADQLIFGDDSAGDVLVGGGPAFDRTVHFGGQRGMGSERQIFGTSPGSGITSGAFPVNGMLLPLNLDMGVFLVVGQPGKLAGQPGGFSDFPGFVDRERLRGKRQDKATLPGSRAIDDERHAAGGTAGCDFAFLINEGTSQVDGQGLLNPGNTLLNELGATDHLSGVVLNAEDNDAQLQLVLVEQLDAADLPAFLDGTPIEIFLADFPLGGKRGGVGLGKDAE